MNRLEQAIAYTLKASVDLCYVFSLDKTLWQAESQAKSQAKSKYVAFSVSGMTNL
ncbi:MULTISPECIES: hypothetical protein [Planktothricoides]|uniref:Transposase n=2 Tax=Planktothricoides raciborskii TaxID=132608 RepID=A0AAU8JCZ4_9CYAN|nr:MULTISPECIES: hypothetical protein [Planktothricoides]MBD2545874.1 hypothetical protein [Planktothricoides raciborskii FACHB-1370]MBD2584132.1 hypothetical protein [Planktothricoides raciborskii FACHB-1261]